MEKQSSPFGMIVGKMLTQMLRALKKRTSEQTEAKLTIEQFGLLYAISKEKNEVIQTEMAEILGKDKSAILRMIDSLEKKELVRRVVDQNDRRKNHIMVSKKGERAIEQWLKIESILVDELLIGLDESDLKTFHKVSDHIRINADKILTH
jgi:MarR family transcriptional regulator, transcriptional regulator for hemolysin